MKFEQYNNWSQLPEYVEVLFEHASQSSMFLSREWFETLYDTTANNDEPLMLACVMDDHCVYALLPLIGAHNNKDSFSHRYSALFSLLLAEKNKIEVINCLVEGLNQLSIHSLALSPIATDDKNLLSLKKALESHGFETHQKFFFYNWIHHTKGQSFNEYMAQRPSQLRNTIKRKKNKLEREHDYKITLFTGNQVQQGLVGYHFAYSASWKANEQCLALLDALAINLSKPNWTRLAVLTINGQAAAAQLWFVVQGKASIFRLAYDEQWKCYSPGSILTEYLMQYVIDVDKVDEIDFLTGNEPYKQDWMTERRERFRVAFIKPPNTDNKSDSLLRRLQKAIFLFLKSH